MEVDCRFTQDFLLRILNSVVPNRYDFFYMPVDFKTNCNLGFGYVSMLDTASVVKLYDAVGLTLLTHLQLNLKRWPNTPSSKICEIVYARMQVGMHSTCKSQGRDDMQHLCQDWAIMQLPDKYKPVFFEKKVVRRNGISTVIMKRIRQA